MDIVTPTVTRLCVLKSVYSFFFAATNVLVSEVGINNLMN